MLHGVHLRPTACGADIREVAGEPKLIAELRTLRAFLVGSAFVVA